MCVDGLWQLTSWRINFECATVSSNLTETRNSETSSGNRHSWFNWFRHVTMDIRWECVPSASGQILCTMSFDAAHLSKSQHWRPGNVKNKFQRNPYSPHWIDRHFYAGPYPTQYEWFPVEWNRFYRNTRTRTPKNGRRMTFSLPQNGNRNRSTVNQPIPTIWRFESFRNTIFVYHITTNCHQPNISIYFFYFWRSDLINCHR